MMADLELTVFRFINGACSHPFLDILMPIITEIGSGEGIFILSFLPLLLAKNGRKKAAVALWAGLTVTYYVSYFLKGAIARPRPFLVLPDAHLFCVEKSFSFPSTHAMQAFMAATVASHFFGKALIVYSLAALVALSRVYMGVHYPTDVLGGALIGIFIGYILTRFFPES